MLSSFHLYRWAKGGGTYTSKWILPFLGASIVSFFWSDGPMKLACSGEKEIELGRHII